VALRRGVYVERHEYDAASPAERSKARAVAACLARPRSVVSHHSAALVHALPLLGSRPVVPALTFPADVGRHADTDRSVMVRACVLPRWQIQCRGAWRVTSAARTVCDLAREGRLMDTVALVDCALFRGLTTLKELCAVRDSCSTWPGSDRLRHLLRLADDRSESPYESVARYQLIRSGFEVVPQVWACDGLGPTGCGDLWLPRLWAFLEVDGDVKYLEHAAPGRLIDEKLRQERLEEAGFGVARISARSMVDRDLVVQRVQRASARGRLARSISPSAGYVAGPPPWARRGSAIAIGWPAEQHL
jgi:hypothetical protein